MSYMNPIFDIGTGVPGEPGSPETPVDPGLNPEPQTPITIIRDWVLPVSLNFNIVMDAIESVKQNFTIAFRKYPNPPDTLEYKWTFENDPDDISDFIMGDILLDQTYAYTPYQGMLKVLNFQFKNTELLPEGTYTGSLKVTVREIGTGTFVEDKTIPVVLNVIYYGTITTDIAAKDYLFCLDENIITVESELGRFVDVDYVINFKNTNYFLHSRFVVFREFCLINIGIEIQPFVYLNENEINQFFNTKKLDMSPAVVNIKISVLDDLYSEIMYEEYEDLLFHAGKSSCIPDDDTTIERSLSWNSHLPLAYHFPGQNVEFKYKDFSKIYNKQQNSAANHIFQMMFIQKYHYADQSGINASFSNGFSAGFATINSLLNANPFYKYDENYINLIESSYNIKGINFPWQKNSINIFWLDESNIFNGMTFTGHSEKNVEFSHFLNDLPEYFYNKKAGNTRTKKMKLNTGWKLFSETKFVLELIKSNRCWIFGDDPVKRTEAVCITDKLQESSTLRELNEFTLEFIINE